jgi:hypothetical protein
LPCPLLPRGKWKSKKCPILLVKINKKHATREKMVFLRRPSFLLKKAPKNQEKRKNQEKSYKKQGNT